MDGERTAELKINTFHILADIYTIRKFETRTCIILLTHLIGRIHGAIVAATVGAIVAATGRLYCIHEATVAAIGCGDDRRDDRPVYTAYYSLPCDALQCKARSCDYIIVRLSVCLSVTLVDCEFVITYTVAQIKIRQQ